MKHLFTMINTQEFTVRLQKIMEEYELSSSAFAEKIDVGRSSISHLVSGRNKPSLDIILKILDEFPQVEFDWLVRGKGNFEIGTETDEAPDFEPDETKMKKNTDVDELNAASRLSDLQSPDSKPTSPLNRTVSKIVFFYRDGSFDIFQNN